MKHLVLYILIFASAVSAFCQNPNTPPNFSPSTTKTPKATYQITKTSVTRYSYNVNSQTATPQPVDTALPGSQNHLPLYSSFASWSSLGNTGLPAIINRYRSVRDAFNPLMFEGADGYGSGNDLVFYSANSPYSILNYNSGGTSDKNGQTIKALFARNLKKKGNITFLGNYYNSDGHFSKQACNTSVFNVNYILNRKNYNLTTGIARNSFKFAENGGLTSDDQLIGSALPAYLPVNLSGAATNMSVLTWQGVQSGSVRLSKKQPKRIAEADSLPKVNLQDSLRNLPLNDMQKIQQDSVQNMLQDTAQQNPEDIKSIRVVHTFRLSDISRKYSDIKTDAGFYQNTYSDTQITNDSMRFLSFTNSVDILSDTLHAGKLPFIAKAGINPDFYRYQNAGNVSFGFAIGLNASVSKRSQFSGMQIDAAWSAAGYTAGDYSLAGTYKLVPAKRDSTMEMVASLFTRGCSPDPIIRNFESNHFRWTNDFLRQHETGLKLALNFPKIKSSLEASMITNMGWIYFDTVGLPAQLNDRMNVVSLNGSKEFTAGVFHSVVSALVQYSTSDKIRLPLFVGSTSTFIHHDIYFPKTKGKLEVEYGFDLRYNTAFYGYAYMPATGIFYGENEKMLGNYPNLTGFIQMKVKRTRLCVQWCQTFADMLPEQSFAVLHYPSMRPHLKYGVYWHFYD